MIHASLLEMVWTAGALFGALFQGGHAWRSIENYRLARDNGQAPAVLLLAKSKIRNMASRLILLLLFLFIGVLSMVIPDAERASTSIVGALFGLALILAEVVIVLDAVLDYVDWLRLMGEHGG